MSALIVVVCQDRPADNGDVRVGSQGVVRELIRKIRQVLESIVVHPHGDVLFVEDDAVFVVVDVRGILHVVSAAAEIQGDDAQILSGRVICMACKSHILLAQQTSRISRGLLTAGGCDFPRIFFRLRQVDGDLHGAVLRVSLELDVFVRPVLVDVVGADGQVVEPVGGPGGVLCIQGLEPPDDLPWTGHDDVHDPGIQQIPGCHGVFHESALHCLIQQTVHDLRQGG